MKIVEIFDEAEDRCGGELPESQAEELPPQRCEAIGICLLLFASSMRETDAYRFCCSWNVAPSGSVTVTMRPYGESSGPASTVPPSSVTFDAAASASSTLK